MRLRKAGFASGLLVSLVAVGFAAAAFACTSLATLDVPAAPAQVGSNAAVAGAAFSPAGTPVIIHWGSASGPEVARAQPDASGRISTSFAVPEATPGYHVLVATQLDAEGKAILGTPARASFGVAAPDGTVPAAPAVAPAAEPTSGGSDSVLPVTLVLGAVGVALFGAGLATTRRQNRRRPAPAPARLD